MFRSIHFLFLVACVFLAAQSALAQRRTVTITISPTSATLAAGATRQFTATVTNTSDTSVEWEVNGISGGSSSVGSISGSGLYRAPSNLGSRTSVTVTAISNADDSKSASATVSFSATASVSVSLSPASASVQAGGSQRFTATVQNTSNTAVTWQVNGVTGGNTTNGTISTGGNYTAPSNVSTQRIVTVTAISQADTTKSATAQVTLTVPQPVTVSVSPLSASLAAGATRQFTATVQNTSNTSVTWRVNGITGGSSSVGTISTSGSYRAPATVTSQTVVTVTAVSQADTTKSASAQVTLVVPLPVSVMLSPTAASLIGGASQRFTATVQNATNTAVTWQVNGINGGNSTVGTISSTGNYRAPATIATQTTVTVKAISVQDTTKSATALVTLNPVAVMISPLAASLLAGGQQQFAASVQNASSNSVTWLVNGASGGNATVGTVSTSGLYRAPATVAAQTIVNVAARSQVDATKSASASVTLNPPTPPVSVVLTPTSASLVGGATQLLLATVRNSTNTAVTWYVNNILGGNASTGTIANGLYTAPAVVPVQTAVTVKAVSIADATKSASATITIVPVTISVSPPSVALAAGGTQTIAATVQNALNPAVTWYVNDIAGGAINTVGSISAAGVYVAPASVASLTTVTVKAISQADPTKSAMALVSINPVAISVLPDSVLLGGGGTQTFVATVQNSADSAVDWSVNNIRGGDIATVGSISPAGVYTAPTAVANSTTVTVKAVSQADPSKAAMAQVSISAVAISVSPGSSSLGGGGTQTFSATVQHTTNTAVTWSVNDILGGDIATVGSISDSGVYLAPTSVSAQTVVTVKALSQAQPVKFGTAQVTLKPIAVLVSPAAFSLGGGGTQNFAAMVQNSSDTAVTWFVNEVQGGDIATVGSISEAGVYLAPSFVATLTTVTVKAVSQADSAKFGTAAVTIHPVNLSVAPASAILGAGGTQTFAATAQNVSNTSVTWYVNDVPGGDSATGTISVAGVYIAPASVPAQTTVTVKAISEADPSKTATASIMLNPLAINISPNPVILGGGATQTFSASLEYTSNTAVTWYVNDVPGGDITTVGSISESGIYTAPSAVSSQTDVTVKATSQADISKSATAQVTLNPVAVSVSPEAPTVGISKTKQFTASVQYTTDTTVTWQVNGAEGGDDTNGHITPAGLYTAPASVPDPATVTITAVSQADPARSGYTQASISAATGKSYYVATTGNDTAAGTFDAPWRTISRAAAAASGVMAGDTVYVRGGIYNESVTVAVSGSALPGPITFQNYPNEIAILDGTGLAVPTSPRGMFHLNGRSYVTISGFEIRNYQTASSSAIPAGIWITGSGSNIQILNNIVHDIKTSSERSGQAYGISVYGTGATLSLDTVTIDGNQVYNLKTGGSESVNVDGNVTNFAITNNIVHDNDNIAIDAIGGEGVSSNTALDYARNGIISGNTIYNISGINNPGENNEYNADGIYVDGGSQILIERNLIHHVDIGIEAAAEHKSRNSSYITIRNNLIYASNSIAISIGGYDSRRGGADHCVIVNNTLYGNDTKNTGSGEFQIQYFATNNVFKNNIVYGTSQGLLVNSYTNSSANPVDIDNNLYFSPLASTSAKFVWNGTTRNGLSSFQTATGKDVNSRYLDPLFLNLAAADLHVQPTSPARDLGLDLTPDINGAKDLAGNPRIQGANIDLGAYEQ
jgi:hypothetical protein